MHVTLMWDVVENGNYIPTNKEGAKISRSSWNEKQKTRYHINSKARYFSRCKSSKEMWDTLALAYEGTSYVIHSKISMLVH
ncbi:hypothetical protein CR513_30358, partial [Mucuna pruriens]